MFRGKELTSLEKVRFYICQGARRVDNVKSGTVESETHFPKDDQCEGTPGGDAGPRVVGTRLTGRERSSPRTGLTALRIKSRSTWGTVWAAPGHPQGRGPHGRLAGGSQLVGNLSLFCRWKVLANL